MRKNLVLIGAIVTIVLFVTSCTTQSGQTGFGFGKKSSDRFDDDTPFTAQSHQGTNGLVLQFAKNNPPNKVYYTSAGTPFNIIVELRNRGAHEIDDAYLYLTGYDKNIIQNTRITPGGTLPLMFDLESVTNFNPEGGYTTLEVENTIMNWPIGTDSYKPTIRASACYKYETVANPVICVDPHPFSSLSEDKPCRVRNSYDYSGQGAPISISRVEQEGTEDYLHLKIQIQNMQPRGVVYDENKYDPDRGSDSSSCPFNLQYKDINKVHYDQPEFSGSGARPELESDCKPDSPVRLVDNKATIFCKFTMPRTDEIYQSPVNIRLHYGYLNYEEMNVDIRNVASE